jgi:cation diffusion facilitator CzcD-associated flavoprotein CzcO
MVGYIETMADGRADRPRSGPGGESTGAGLPRRVRVAVVGSGFAGLGMAIRLKQEGIHDFVVLERAGEVGGTWRDNTYPGAACDVPSQLYSFSFAANPEWSHNFSSQPEILGYLRRCSDAHGVTPHVRFGAEVLSARWEDSQKAWRIETTRGTLSARVLVSGMGAMSKPYVPPVPGLDAFEGTVFHSARWDHSHDLRGSRVAVVGTGASSVQIVPSIQPIVERLHVFQRTPPWVVPRRERRFSRPERWLFRRAPGLQRLVRAGIYWGRELYVPGFSMDPRLMKVIELVARAHLRVQVPDRGLRERLTPDYTIGCKRILVSSDYYPSLLEPNVALVPSDLVEVRGSTVVAADGTEREVETIIFATGFRVTDAPAAQRLRGRDGVLLADAWRNGMRAYKGTTIAGFPNLFMVVGPNTLVGHNSQVFMIEAQIEYVLECLRFMDRRGAQIVEVRPPAQNAYDTYVQERMRGTVWTNGGCGSWYLDAAGRNTTLWPTFTWRFWQRTRRFEPADHIVHGSVDAGGGGGEDRTPGRVVR